MLATTYGVGQVVYTILWFFLLFIEVWLSISIFIDIFRSHDLKGWQKALWILFVLLIPLLGILVYFIVRGDQMRAHQIQAQQEAQAFREFQGGGSGGSSAVSDLSRLADLKRDGVITEAEFEELKSRIIQR
jgi:hypothetical protein